MDRDIRLLLVTLVVASTIALLSGTLSVDRWLMTQVIILTYLAPSPLKQNKDKED